MTTEFYQGRVKFFSYDKGFGFIRKSNGDVFLHETELPYQYHPMSGDLVEYAVKQTRRGPVAVQVKFLSRSDKHKPLALENLRADLDKIKRKTMGGL